MNAAPNTKDMKARDIMTPHIKTVHRSWTMQKFAQFLSDNDISGSPVANENGELIGNATLYASRTLRIAIAHQHFRPQLSGSPITP